MKTNLLSISINKEEAGRSIVQKLLMASLIVALLFASLPVYGAFAAPANAVNSVNDFEQQWEKKTEKVRVYGIFYERVRVYPADFEDRSELAQAHDYLNQYGAALRRAQTILLNRAGFDSRGRVINENLADQSLKDLSTNLRTMRVLKGKLDALEGDYRLLSLSDINTASQ